MDIGLCLPYTQPDLDRDRLIRWCRHVEESGLASISCGERIIGPSVDMGAALAAAAAVTERVQIIPSLYVLPMHSAVWAAKNAATLDVISGGRVTVVVGVGGRPQDYRCMERPMEKTHIRMDSQVETMRRVWSGDPPFEDGVPVGPQPVQEGGPAVIAGVMGPKATARAAQWADGVYSWSGHGDGEELREQLDRVKSAWEGAGRGQAPRHLAGFWYSLSNDAPQRLHNYVYKYMEFAGPEIATFMADQQTLSNAGAVRRALDAYEEIGVEECLLNPATADLREIDELLQVLATR
jgi:alkanesulfonate monooxygenase SsuD/methylene tetrahydromethanopterin reductase-like flavin-dependent oxidoreductase (luciferase family)